MATVMMHAVVSVDGYIADESDEVGPLFDWYFNGDVPLERGMEDEKVHLRASAGYVHPMWDSIGVRGHGSAPLRPHERLGGSPARR